MNGRRYFVRVGEREGQVSVEAKGDGHYLAHVAEESAPRELTLLGAGPPWSLLVGGRVVELFATTDGGVVAHPSRDRALVSERAKALADPHATDGDALLRAPMPGRVLKLLVVEGQTVTRGDAVAVVEAMKMENELSAPRSGKVKRVLVELGATDERDAPLMELE